MLWERVERLEQALIRMRERVLPAAPRPVPIPIPELEQSPDDLRLFPIVGRDLCYPVTSLLARGKLEEAGRLVPEKAWVASTPLYG
jgi:hypothetical protein